MAVNEVAINGETIISLVDDTVTEDTLLYGTTAHDASGNIITGKYVPYNPNLLINYDFSINQRGLEKYNALCEAVPCVDAWEIFASNSNSEVSFWKNKNITNDPLFDDYGYAILRQKIESPSNLENMTITFRCMLSYLIGTCSVAIILTTEKGVEVAKAESDFENTLNPYVTLKLPEPISDDYVLSVEIRITVAAYLVSSKCAIEEIPSIIEPPMLAIETIKCQRRLLAISGYSRYVATRITANEIDFFIAVPTTLRKTPTVDFSNLVIKSWNGTTSTDVTDGFTFTIATTSSNGVVIRGTKTSHGVTAGYLEFNTKTTPFLLNCEL